MTPAREMLAHGGRESMRVSPCPWLALKEKGYVKTLPDDIMSASLASQTCTQYWKKKRENKTQREGPNFDQILL